MEKLLTLELCRTIVDDCEVIFELGTITYSKENFVKNDLNSTFKLSVQFDSDGKILASVHVNRNLKALCSFNFTEAGNSMIIREIFDSENNTISFYEGQRINLPLNCTSKKDVFDIVLNREQVVAHGKIIKDCNSRVYYVRVV